MLKKIIFKIWFLFFFVSEIFCLSRQEGVTLCNTFLNEEKLKTVMKYIYVYCPSFFYDNPDIYFPIEKENITDFYVNMAFLINFFEPLTLEKICFPINIKSLSDSINKVVISNPLEKDDISSSEMIVLRANRYDIMEKEFFTVLDLCKKKEKNVPIYIVANTEKKYILKDPNITNTIINSIEMRLKRSLKSHERDFVFEHLNNEFNMALVLEHFFNTENNIVLFASHSDNFYNDFFEFLKKRYIEDRKILFLSQEFITSYEELRYSLWKKDFSHKEYEIIFKYYPTMHTENNQQILALQKMKMITALLTEIINNIDE